MPECSSFPFEDQAPPILLSLTPGNLARLEWVENPDVQLPEIRFISRGDDQLANACSRGNQSVLKRSIWFFGP